jgi:PII-like signaling protein
MIEPPAKVLLIFIDETDSYGEWPLYEAILRRLLDAGIAGATVNAGIMGFGSHQQIHRKRLFGVSDDRSITIVVVENEAKLRAILPEIRPMVTEGLLLLLDAEVVP